MNGETPRMMVTGISTEPCSRPSVAPTAILHVRSRPFEITSLRIRPSRTSSSRFGQSMLRRLHAQIISEPQGGSAGHARR